MTNLTFSDKVVPVLLAVLSARDHSSGLATGRRQYMTSLVNSVASSRFKELDAVKIYTTFTLPSDGNFLVQVEI